MTQRAHFWLRIVGLVVIVAAEFAPRLWAAAGPAAAQLQAPAPVAAALDGAGAR